LGRWSRWNAGRSKERLRTVGERRKGAPFATWNAERSNQRLSAARETVFVAPFVTWNAERSNACRAQRAADPFGGRHPPTLRKPLEGHELLVVEPDLSSPGHRQMAG
jgi:hypothetical protein